MGRPDKSTSGARRPRRRSAAAWSGWNLVKRYPAAAWCRDEAPAGRSHIHIGAERIILDEFSARLDHIAHQLGKDVVGLIDLLDLDLQHRALVGVERGLPELARVHFTEAFVALQRYALVAGGRHRLEQADRAMDDGFSVLAAQQARPRIGFLKLHCVIVELARVGGTEQRVIDDGDILDATHGALE